MNSYKDNSLTVLCGHTHCSYYYQINNIEVIVAGGRYSKPDLFSVLEY
jgi:predicted phosphodiesterase